MKNSNKHSAFMVMPFSDSEAEQAYNHCIKPVCDEFSLEIRRADEIFTTNAVYEDIVKEIQEASLIIADTSGRNPNVFYELGIAHTLKQSQTVMITHDDFSTVPFDVSHFRIIRYQNTIQGAEHLRENLRRTLNSVLADLQTLHRAQFEFVIEILISAGKRGSIYSMIGAAQYPGVMRASDPMNSEGHSIDGKLNSSGSASLVDGLETFINLGYVSTTNNIVQVTEMGRAFSAIAMQKGLICDEFNGHIFTPGYTPRHNLFSRKQSADSEGNE